MGLYLLNISVDTADPNPEHIPEDLSYNDQESIVELVVEKILGFEDAFEEYDDNDTEQHTKKTHVKIDFTNHYTSEIVLHKTFLLTTQQNFPHHTTFIANGFQKLDIPPPKV